MELGRHHRHVIHDYDSNTHVSRKIFQQPDIGVKATRRTTDANNRKIFQQRIYVYQHEYSGQRLREP